MMVKKKQLEVERSNEIIKFMLYLLSLWLLFFMLIVLKADFSNLVLRENEIHFEVILADNLVPFICLILMIIGFAGYAVFRDKLRSAKELPVVLVECKSINYENLSFLATYVIPLICFPMSTGREIFVLFAVIIIIGCIFVKTNLFYSNPTLALMGFGIYSVTSKDDIFKDDLVIAIGRLKRGDSIKYINLGDNVYFAKKV